MPRLQDDGPTYPEIIKGILDSITGPIPLQEFADLVLAQRKSTAKDPMTTIKTQLRQENGIQLVLLDDKTILPIRLAMQGARFLIQIGRETINTGLIEIENLLSYYTPVGFPVSKVSFIDINQKPIEFQVKSIKKKVTTILGTYDNTIINANLGAWLSKQKADRKDYLLFTVVDWLNGVFQLDREPYSKHQPKLFQQSNQLLADLFYELLENAKNEKIYCSIAVPTAYARLTGKIAYHPTHWMIALNDDNRMCFDGFRICYIDQDLSPFQQMINGITGESRKETPRLVKKENENQVYRFKAELKHNPKIWREVEIQGSQTLADLNRTLINAFNHEWDHIGGFWKYVPRNATSRGTHRFREVDLGDVDPDGNGEGADVKIAGIELTVGGKLKYVYDFGDWIEHVLKLDAIEPPQAGVDYPRQVTSNQPHHAYCVTCAAKGIKTVATLICVNCSDEQQKRIVLCESCSLEDHEDHYLKNILY